MVRIGAVICAGLMAAGSASQAQLRPDLQVVDALIVDANRQILEMESALDEAEAKMAAWETELSRASSGSFSRQRFGNTGATDETSGDLGAQIADHPGVAFAQGACRDDLLALGKTAFRESAIARVSSAVDCAATLAPRVRIDLPFECASLFWAEDQSGSLFLTGHVQHEADLTALQTRFGRQLTSQVVARPFPVCSALEALELPLTSQNKPSIRMLAGKSRVAYNESLAFEVITPDFFAFVYLAYLQADGTVVNLLPRRNLIRKQHPPRSVLRFGDGLEGRQLYTAASPAGTEAIISIASRSPIEALETLEQGAAGQYFAADGRSRAIDQGVFLDLLNSSIDVEFKAGAGQREISAEVLHLTVVPG
ncbi:MAG: hypothetical protein AAF566_05320 [Pseudomonadota bacterium]